MKPNSPPVAVQVNAPASARNVGTDAARWVCLAGGPGLLAARFGAGSDGPLYVMGGYLVEGYVE